MLLGMKKKGFGMGKWNGFGGKIERGESPIQAAARELTEEAGIVGADLVKRGILLFQFVGDPRPMEVHVFRATTFTGDITESDEMRPQWFAVEDVPFDMM